MLQSFVDAKLESIKNADFLMKSWNRLRKLPGGGALFQQLVRQVVPYSATIHPEIVEFTPGHAKLAMRDRKAVRNHLRSIHAIALANLAELASGLAMTSVLPKGTRGILKGFSIDYLKKGRGTLVAESHTEAPNYTGEKLEITVTVETFDSKGDCVTRGSALWLIGPAR